jgi:rhodanese-related sulfurtransferase
MESITVRELKEHLGDADTLLIDVREVFEFSDSRIPGAENIPVSELQSAVERLKGVGTVYVQCASGGRSMRASDALLRAGVHAINVEGGLYAWEAAGFEVVTSE